jgi:hypothetical protein
MWTKKKLPVPPPDPELVKQIAASAAERAARRPASGTCGVSMPLSEIKRGTGPFCERKLVEGSNFCFWHLPDIEKYSAEALAKYFGREITLGKALEEEVAKHGSLENAFLQNAYLGGDFLKRGPCLRGAFFVNADLRGASMSESDLTDVIFVASDLTRAKLSSCVLTRVNFANARLFETKFRDNEFEGVTHLFRSNFRGLGKFGLPVDRMLEEYPEQAAPMYRALVGYFSARGLLDDASWAAYRASRVQHRTLSKDLRSIKAKWIIKLMMPRAIPVQAPPYVEYASLLTRWAKSGLFLIITGYGEKPTRVVLWALLLILVYAGMYCIPGATTGHGFYEALYFSVVTFTTLGYGDLLPRGHFRLIAGSEALCGILFTGLFLFCIGRRTVGRG